MRLLLVDDHCMVRRALRRLLEDEPDLEVVGEAGEGRDALAQAARLRPDVIVLDLVLPGMGGLEVIPELARRLPGIAVVVLSMYSSEPYVKEALRSGACCYVRKQADVGELVRAVREAAAGHRYLSPPLARWAFDAYAEPDRPADPYWELTPRQREVLRLVALGHTSRQIAALLTISPRTVESHRASVLDRLGLTGTAELVRYAVGRGVVQPLAGRAPGDGTPERDGPA